MTDFNFIINIIQVPYILQKFIFQWNFDYDISLCDAPQHNYVWVWAYSPLYFKMCRAEQYAFQWVKIYCSKNIFVSFSELVNHNDRLTQYHTKNKNDHSMVQYTLKKERRRGEVQHYKHSVKCNLHTSTCQSSAQIYKGDPRTSTIFIPAWGSYWGHSGFFPRSKQLWLVRSVCAAIWAWK